MKKLKKFLIPLGIIVAIVLVLVISGVISANKAMNEQFDAQPVTAKAENNDVGIYVSASGMLETGVTEAIHADTQGTITDVVVNAGDFVTAGDVIAVVDPSDLDDLIKETEDSIKEIQGDIDNFDTVSDSFIIRSPINGRVKDVTPTYIDPEEEYDNNDDDDTNDIIYEKCEDLEAKYGYLVEIAVGDTMWIVTDENVAQYEVGQSVAVKVHEWNDYYYKTDVFVEKIEDGKAYISIPTNYRLDGKEATIYAEDGRTVVGSGITEYLGLEYVTGYKGYITTTNAYINEKVSVGEVLYYAYTTESQDLLELYIDLNDKKADLADYEEQRANVEIKAQSDGFINEINLVQGESVSDDTIAYKLSNTSIWQATVDVDELDINQLRSGMTAFVTVDAIPDVEFVGTVTDMSSVGTNEGGITTYDVAVELDADERFRVNMNASSEILVNESLGTITVPIQAVRTVDDVDYVLVHVDRSDSELKVIEDELKAEFANTVAQDEEKMPAEMTQEMKIEAELSVTDRLYGEVRIVESGLQDETNIEILSGLSEGEVVILPSDQLSEDAVEEATVAFGPGANR